LQSIKEKQLVRSSCHTYKIESFIGVVLFVNIRKNSPIFFFSYLDFILFLNLKKLMQPYQKIFKNWLHKLSLLSKTSKIWKRFYFF